MIAYAQANNITHIIIGKSSRSRWFEILHGSVVHELVRRSGNISVHVIAGEELGSGADPQEDRADRQSRPRPGSAAPLLGAVIAVALALGVGILMRPGWGSRRSTCCF